jgi:natural product precursor
MKTKMKLNKLVENQISDSKLKNLIGGAPGTPCGGQNCGSDATLNVNNVLAIMRKLNPPLPPPPPTD